jgi:hypothetical protein
VNKDAQTYALRPPSNNWGVMAGALMVLVLAAAMAVLWWWEHRPQSAVDEAVLARLAAAKLPAPAPASVAAAPPPPPASAPLPEPAPEPTPGASALSADALRPALSELFGAKAALSLLQLDDFPRRFVATVDNLGRSHAPSVLWPVQPSAGRFLVIENRGRTVISPDNGLRYTPLVLLVEHLDTRRAVSLYLRMLPLLQQTYADLGYPNGRFHARLLEVIDQLLATPTAPELVPVTMTEIRGPYPSQRPWVHEEFSDPAFESASAGQKILLRVGAVNERRLKAKLREWRAELARQAVDAPQQGPDRDRGP